MCRPDGKGNLAQAQLGGTPWYATPSHFFGNNILQNIYEDLGLILHLQDWHAMVGIIFETVTGQRLFTGTARLIPSMIRSITNVVAKGGSLQTLFQQYNQRFWQQAEAEIGGKIRNNRQKLDALSVFLPDSIHEQMKRYISRERKSIDRSIVACYEEQKVISSKKKLDDLLNCSHDSFRKTQEKYRRMDSSSAQQLTELLKAIEPLKLRKARIEKLSEILAVSTSPLTVRRVLESMFGAVRSAMVTAEMAVVDDKPMEDVEDPEESGETVKGFLGYTITSNLS